ncbi:uncharacterized protein K441DRAFT_615469 [Cenococcum geophilum 1.58]|uniref:uncharacterized protein n=1 Tax=Cenococcum geophilum 1.58 TaxID=794803 RepID=UPI00358FDF9A|nr:hypothetical protein K441DRAFT_615469 [Cenococcum geophilum 1.58]
MAPTKRPQQYNESMRKYEKGYAFFEPASSFDVKPGCSGYIDAGGIWHPLVDIMDSVAVQKLGLSDLDQTIVVAMRPSSMRWGPRYSQSVKYNRYDVDLGANGVPAGIPAEAKIVIKFDLGSQFGAVLICDSEVKMQGYHHLAPFRDWARKNAEKILNKFPDVYERGFFIAVSTYSTKDVYINSWSDKSQSVTLGFKLGVIPAGEIAPETEWYRGDSTSEWTRHMSNDKVKEIIPDKWRGANFIIRDPTNEDDALEVKMSLLGKD